MERETKTIKTPSGAEVVLKTWISGAEARALKLVYYGGLKVGGGQSTKSGAEIMAELEDMAFKTVIVSINGSSENILETILAMKVEDYQAVLDAVNAVKDGITEEKKSS